MSPAKAIAVTDASAPSLRSGRGGALLDVRDLAISFATPRGDVRAVHSVSFSLKAGETMGLVGESGSGKSVTVRALMGLLPKPSARVDSGTAVFAGQDLLTLSSGELRRLRGRSIAMIFQDPMRSLNPMMKVGNQIGEALCNGGGMSKRDARARAVELLEAVRIPSARQRVDSYPHELSGGMRQRVVIAIALSCSPQLLIADEPTTALDVTVQAQILDLLRDLQRDLSMAMILVTHDLGVAARYTDDVAVMYAGRIVEHAPTRELFTQRRMPYTQALLASVPRLDAPPHALLDSIPGRPPDLSSQPPGCPFHPRCPRALDRCASEEPTLTTLSPGHRYACWNPLGQDGQEGASHGR